MAATPTSECLEQIGRWSQPIIFDTVLAVYKDRSLSDATSLSVANLHAKVWRMILSGEFEKRWKCERELAEFLLISRLRRSTYDLANARVFAELTEIIKTRHRSTPRAGRAYFRTLDALRERVDPLRLAA